MKNANLKLIYEEGQAIWYDNISRDELSDGTLSKLIEQGVTGLTSNPSIFKKAIVDTTFYDDAISSCSQRGLDVHATVEELMTSDVADAAKLLKPVYEKTKGRDGYASIEVSPVLAADTKKTISEAERLWNILKLENVMIKIPATNEGLPAIEETLKKGINVNVTLIFSPAAYEAVLERFLRACEWRLDNQLSISSLASVASFFVSRLDVLFEREKGTEASTLVGEVGIANSLKAYSHFQEVLASSRVKSLEDQGMMIQRPLWASTSAKNKGLDETHYVPRLLKPLTVNTLPPKTLEALIALSRFEPDSDSTNFASVMKAAQEHHFDFDSAYARLLSEGVDAFTESYNELLASVDSRL